MYFTQKYKNAKKNSFKAVKGYKIIKGQSVGISTKLPDRIAVIEGAYTAGKTPEHMIEVHRVTEAKIKNTFINRMLVKLKIIKTKYPLIIMTPKEFSEKYDKMQRLSQQPERLTPRQMDEIVDSAFKPKGDREKAVMGYNVVNENTIKPNFKDSEKQLMPFIDEHLEYLEYQHNKRKFKPKGTKQQCLKHYLSETCNSCIYNKTVIPIESYKYNHENGGALKIDRCGMGFWESKPYLSFE